MLDYETSQEYHVIKQIKVIGKSCRLNIFGTLGSNQSLQQSWEHFSRKMAEYQSQQQVL